MRFKFVAIRVALLLPALCAVMSAPLTAERKEFRDTTNVVTVEVPITVTRGSKPVRGLTADNFEIRIDGETQEIRSLQMIDLYPPTAGPMGNPVHPPIQGRRHFLLFFDLANSYPRGIFRARKAAREVVRTMHPSDLVAVGLYDHIKGIQFLLGFTTDRHQVDIALESFGLPGLFNPVNDPLQLSLAQGRGSEAAASPIPGGGFGRAAGLGLEADQRIFETVTAQLELDRYEAIERFKNMTEDFESMARGLAAVQGQVHIVYLTEGPSAGLLLGGRSSAQTRDDIERGRIWNVPVGAAGGGSTRGLNALEGMIESLRRAEAIVHSVDVGGIRAEGSFLHRPGNPDVLNAVAQGTGGEVYDNFNDLTDAMGLILEATSVTYLATLQPQGLPMDGEYRKLKVKLKDGPRSAKVSHRAGFFAPRPYEQSDVVEKQLASAQLILRDDDTGLLDLDLFAAAVPVAGEKAYVPLMLELDGARLMAVAGQKPRLGLQLFTYAFGDDGQIHDFYTELVDLDLSQVGEALENGGLKYYSHLDLEPGHYRVRVLVRDLASGEFGVRSADVTVDAAGSSLLPVLVADAPGAWLMARESVSRRREVPFPFLAGDKPFFPMARPTLPRSGKTDVIVQLYGPGGSELQARIVDLDGNLVRGEARLELGALEPAGDAPGKARVARSTLETQDLRRGFYELVLTAPGAAESRIRVEVQ